MAIGLNGLPVTAATCLGSGPFEYTGLGLPFVVLLLLLLLLTLLLLPLILVMLLLMMVVLLIIVTFFVSFT